MKVKNVGTVPALIGSVPCEVGETVEASYEDIAATLHPMHHFKVDWEPEYTGPDSLTLVSSCWGPRTSMGPVTLAGLLAMDAAGIHVTIPFPETARADGELLRAEWPEAWRIMHRPDKRRTEWGIARGSPVDIGVLPTPRKILWGVVDMSRVPHPLMRHALDADAIIVPSPGVVSVFRDSGITETPIYVVPDFISDAFQPVEREPRDTYSFLCFGDLSVRKQPYSVLAAFRKAFARERDVRLIFKTRKAFGSTYGVPVIDDSRVTIIQEHYSEQQLVDLCQKADCGIQLSRFECFYQVPPQQMRTGLPVISCTHSACVSWCDSPGVYKVGLDPQRPTIPASTGPFGSGYDGKPAEWFNPSIDETIAQMRHVYECREEAAQRGKEGAEWMRGRFTKEEMATALLDALKEICG